MGFFKDFKKFAVKGNLADLTIGVVIGGAFASVVKSFIDGLIMPLVGVLTGGVDFNDKKYVIIQGVAEVKDAAGTLITKATPEVALKYGTFIGSIITFTIVALVCYMIIKNLLKKDPNAAPDPSSSEILLGEIRDLLKNEKLVQ
jgi:large conductance mechanosensitive channel